MKTSTFRISFKSAVLLYLGATSLTLFSANSLPLNIGCGEPGLHIIYVSKNRSVIYLDEPDTVGSWFVGGDDKRKIQVVFDRNYGLQDKLRTGRWGGPGEDPQQLYPFDEQTAFTCEVAPVSPMLMVKDRTSLVRLRFSLPMQTMF